MSNPACTTSSLASTNTGFGLAGLTEPQYKAALIYFKVLELAAIGGTDYRTSLMNGLVNDANALASQMTPDQRRISALNVAMNKAIAAGATVPDPASCACPAAGGSRCRGER